MYSITLQYSAPSPSAVTHGVIEHADEARALKRQHAQFSKELLLANTLTKSAGRQLVGLIVAWRSLDDRLFLIR